MSIPSDCCNPCPSVTAVNVPGSPGTNGLNAFTSTTATLTLPAQNANVIVSVAETRWMAVGQIVFASDGIHTGTFQVVSVPAAAPFTTATLQFLYYSTDSAPATVIASGATLTPAGVETSLSFPIPVANGGTGAANAATARSNLGAAASGSNSDITSLNTLTTPLSVSQGGTGAATVATARAALAIQAGTATLAAGTKTVNTVVTITANSIILVTLETPAGTRTGFAGYKITAISAGVPGVGSFVITAIDDSAATLGSCTDVVFFHIIG